MRLSTTWGYRTTAGGWWKAQSHRQILDIPLIILCKNGIIGKEIVVKDMKLCFKL